MSFWTPAMEKMLRNMWYNGASARDIATAIKDDTGIVFTKNAIIGKAGRMKLGIHEKSTKYWHKSVTDDDILRRARISAMMGQPTHRVKVCQWPHGEPGTPQYHVCGSDEVVEGKPYCATHCAIAYRPKEQQPTKPPKPF